MNNDRVKALLRILQENEVRPSDAEAALELHLGQLQRLGATLEDSVCEILRKVIAQGEAIKELDEITLYEWRTWQK